MTEGADGEPRAGLLETIHEYALERLAEAGEEEQTRRRHAGHYAAFAEQAISQLHGREGLAWLDRLEAEHDNLRAALSWSLEAGAADSERSRPACGWSRRWDRSGTAMATPPKGGGGWNGPST